MSYRKTSSFPKHDVSLASDAEKGQITLNHNMEKRHRVIVANLPKFGPKGATVEILRSNLNKVLKTNFNPNHIRYALEVLRTHDVIGKRGNGETAVYYARVTTAARFEKVVTILRGKH